jgi:hypothetical protein
MNIEMVVAHAAPLIPHLGIKIILSKIVMRAEISPEKKVKSVRLTASKKYYQAHKDFWQ